MGMASAGVHKYRMDKKHDVTTTDIEMGDREPIVKWQIVGSGIRKARGLSIFI